MRSKKDACIGGIHSMVRLKSHLVWGKNEKLNAPRKKTEEGGSVGLVWGGG